MKKKQRYFSVIVVILLLANNTSGATQVIAEEVSKNNSIEKIGNEKEDTKQDSDTINSSEKQNIEEKDKNLSNDENNDENNDDTEEGIQTDLKQFLPEFSASIDKDYASKTGYSSWGRALVYIDSSTGEVSIGGVQDIPGLPIPVGSVNEAPWRNGEIDPSKVTSITFESFNVLPDNSSQLFAGLSNLREINFKSLNTSNVTNMTNMFRGASSLTTLDLSGFDTSNVKEMYGMFDGASSLTTLDLSGFNTSKVTSLYAMFYGASSLTTIDLSGFNTSNVTSMTNMFYGASSLTTLDLSGFDTSKVTDMEDMFLGLPKLQKLTLGDSFRFKQDARLGTPAGINEKDELTGNWIREDGKSKGYSPEDFMEKYGQAEDLTAGTYVAETKQQQQLWGTSPWSFDEETGTLTVEPGKLAVNNAEENQAPWNRTDDKVISKDKIKKIEFTGKVIAPQNSSSLFDRLTSLSSIEGLKNLDTSNVTDMHGMFDGASSLTTLDLSGFGTSNVTSMTSMFRGASSLTTLDLSGFDTSNVKYMSYMFENVSSLTNVDLSSWDTSKVTEMDYMFNGASSLSSLDLSSWDTSKLGSYAVGHGMRDMFNGLNLKKLILGDSFRFKQDFDEDGTVYNAGLGSPAGLNEKDELTGNWIREDGKSKGYSPSEFMDKYGQAEDLTAGTYMAQVSRFGFKEVPEKLSFKETKISNRTTLTQRQDPQWKMTVEDTRPTSSNWHVTAKMEEKFKDSKGNPVDSDLLLFRKNGQADQWINSKSETMVYEGKGNPVKDDHDISWDEKEGPLIQVAPGAVKADEYKGDITWNLVDAPL